MIESMIANIEKGTGQNADYLRDVARESKGAFLKFVMMMPMANHRLEAPKEAWHAARLIATRHEDCGPCVQIVVDMALADGVESSLLQDIWLGRLDRVPAEVAAACRLATAVVERRDDAATRSAEIASLLSPKALVDLSFAIAAARVFPTLKRSLGYARSCAVVDLHAGSEELGQGAREIS